MIQSSILRATVLTALLPALASAAPPPAAGPRLTTAQAEALVREVSAAVEQIRGLKFKTPVAMKVIDGATARENFRAKIPAEHEAEIRYTQAAYVHLGLVPKGTDLLTGYLDLAEKDVLGYYESGSKTFYLLDHVRPAEVRSVVAHELTHALEDQNYDLGALQRKARDDDHAIAIRALVEGSATAVMLAFVSRDQGQEKASQELEKGEAQRAQRLQIAPSFTQRSVLMPYVLGFTFLLRGKPWGWITEGGVLIKDLEQA
jgi:hypothetical protein